MATRTQHPSPAELRAFGQGRLDPAASAAVEEHVATCDECCRALSEVGDDTLVQLARAAATKTYYGASSARPSPHDARTPAELVDHPRYRVVGLLGRGGMGAVYKAEHRLMERTVALKVINRAFTANPSAVERFRREVRAAAKLAHPNIVTAHDAEQAGELHFLVMEYVDGVSLDRLIASRGAVTPQQACHLIRQAALGLQHASDQGMVHRDIKPQNLMVARKGQVKILDFGLARLASEQPLSADAGGGGAGPAATAAGVVLGTPDYIAPEQIQNAHAADIRADIYSLGCTFYFLLTGQPPFPHGTVVDKVSLHLSQSPRPVRELRPDVPDEVAAILAQMLEKDPARRFATPAEVARELAPHARSSSAPPPTAAAAAAPELAPFPLLALLPAEPLAEGPPAAVEAPATSRSWVEQLPTPFRRNPRALAAAGAIGAILLVATLAGWWSGSFRSPPASRPSGGPSPAADSPATTAASRKVLFMLPSQGLWHADYEWVRERLAEAGLTTVVAAPTLAPSRPHELAPGQPVPVDRRLDARLKAAEFGTIVFVGADTGEFRFGPAAAEVRRLIDEFKAQGKLVTAICKGQQVLADHGELKGRQAAWNNQYFGEFRECGAKWVDQPVVRDGPVLTAADQYAAAPFARAIASALGAPP